MLSFNGPPQPKHILAFAYHFENRETKCATWNTSCLHPKTTHKHMCFFIMLRSGKDIHTWTDTMAQWQKSKHMSARTRRAGFADTCAETQTQPWAQRRANKQTDNQTDVHRHKQTDIHTNIQTYILTDIQTDERTDIFLVASQSVGPMASLFVWRSFAIASSHLYCFAASQSVALSARQRGIRISKNIFFLHQPPEHDKVQQIISLHQNHVTSPSASTCPENDDS